MIPGGKSRIFNILIGNIPPSSWPKELTGGIGFSMNDAKSPDEACQFTSVDFRDKLNKLVKDIYNTLIYMKEDLEETEKQEVNKQP